jgi:hypothetical protein
MGAGVALIVFILARWVDNGLGSLSEQRTALLGATLLIVGVQVFFTSFLLSLLGLRRRPETANT